MKILRPYQEKALQECLTALKKNDEPVLLMASVGAGKSLILAQLLLIFEKLNKRVLCIVNNAELVRNNCETFREQGGSASIFCAALGIKDISQSIIFATPQTILNAINKKHPIADIEFNMIMVDEAHAINYLNHRSSFMRVLRHYKQQYKDMRVLGATGTNFRYKGEPIVGDNCLFKTQVGNISTAWLIEKKFLVSPKFEADKEMTIDFSSLKLNSMGKFDNKQMESVIDKNQRLTAKILINLQEIMKHRIGCFIFCSTLKHCDEAARVLPPHQMAIITGSTSQNERIKILEAARSGCIKYLINVQVLTVGIDVPCYDTLLFLRPTESLVLAVQMIGRVLRLFPGKENALILDCAGNLERHSTWDDPILLDALEQIRDKEKPLIFPCPTCDTMNTEYARRCVGIKENKRCDWYFEWKDCHTCQSPNDITSRYCIQCEAELIDPNSKLISLSSTLVEIPIVQHKFWIQESGKYTQLRASYQTENAKMFYESYTPTASEKSKNMFYGSFVKQHIENYSFWYIHLQNPVYLKAMLNYIKPPSHLILKWDGESWLLHKKVFRELNNP